MDVIWTILIIVGSILVVPLVVFGYTALLGGVILGFIFLAIVTLAGIEYSTPVLITCMVAGVLMLLGTFISRELNNKKNEKGFRSKSNGEDKSMAHSTSKKQLTLPNDTKWREALDTLRSDK